MEKMHNFAERQNKKEKLLEIFREEPDAILILSGAMNLNKVTGKYRSSAFSDKDIHSGTQMITGGKDRVIAAAEASEFLPNSKLVTTSRPLDSDLPSYASIMAKELERLGVPYEKIIKQEESIDTIGGLIDMIKLTKERRWTKIAILSSGYHIPRIKEIFNQLENLLDPRNKDYETSIESLEFVRKNTKATFVPADKILQLRSSHYEKYFEKVKKTGEYKKRMDSEERGIKDIKKGTYRQK